MQLKNTSNQILLFNYKNMINNLKNELQNKEKEIKELKNEISNIKTKNYMMIHIIQLMLILFLLMIKINNDINIYALTLLQKLKKNCIKNMMNID